VRFSLTTFFYRAGKHDGWENVQVPT
jgi:hypothetical protein